MNDVFDRLGTFTLFWPFYTWFGWADYALVSHKKKLKLIENALYY